MMRGVIGLCVVAVVAALAVGGTWQLAEPRIEANRIAHESRALERVIPGMDHDGRLLVDRVDVTAPDRLGAARAPVWFARIDGEPQAVVMRVTAPDGYNGPIRLLLGLDTDGRILGIEILEHRETPGLGDVIEPRRSDWLAQFTGRALGDPQRGGWRLTRDNGEFDGVSGATVTTAAVTRAVGNALLYFDAQRDALLEQGRALPTEPPDGR